MYQIALIMFGKKSNTLKNLIYKELILKVVENTYKNIFLCETNEVCITSKTLCGKMISKL